MELIQIRKLKKGSKFRIQKDGPKFIIEKYSKNFKRYICYNINDISDIEHLKKNTKVFVEK